MKKAIAYVSDIILGRTGEIIKRNWQAEQIKRHAAENGIEIVGWFEDEIYDEDVLMRPGIQALLAFGKPYELLLCERVWALSRSMSVLERFFRELDRRGVKLEATTTMWDCVSQKVRHRFHPSRSGLRVSKPVFVRDEKVKVHVARPARLHFGNIVG